MYKAKEAYQSIDKTDENADTLKDLLDKNPETWEFVKNYSKMKDASPADTIGEVAAGEIPLLLQWDERWGYSVYGDNMIAVNEGAQIKVAYNMSIIKVRAAYNVDGAAKWSDWKSITIT